MKRQYYDTKIIVRKNGQIKITEFDKPIIEDDGKITSGNLGGKGRVSSEDCKNSDTSIRIDSLSRSRNTLIEYCCENHDEFKTFITLTFKENITDLDYANKKFNQYCINIRRKCKKLGFEFKYIGVPEFQKRGAVHYHLLTNLPVDSDLVPKPNKPKRLWSKADKKYVNIKYYDLPCWNEGFSSAFDIVNEVDDNFSLVKYILKYLYKDLDDRLYGRTRVLKSNNLKKPQILKLERESEEYKQVIEWINKKGYKMTNQFEWVTTDEKPFLIPGTLREFSGSQDDNSILRNVLQK